MAVPPIGAALAHLERRGKCFTGFNSGEGHAWHAVKLEWEQNAVPVD